MSQTVRIKNRSLGDWEKAILMGYDVWRQVEENRGGRVIVDLDARLITYLEESSLRLASVKTKHSLNDIFQGKK
ncbi:hypothetical protein [uncultured Nostoc sp.]|uniref:hypothetical protein n=1 Tax=uncultured Nostoc sp. TaxID=340711 RepID=UPI0035CBC0A2